MSLSYLAYREIHKSKTIAQTVRKRDSFEYFKVSLLVDPMTSDSSPTSSSTLTKIKERPLNNSSPSNQEV